MQKLMSMLILLIPGLEMITLWTGLLFILVESAFHGPTTNLVADIIARGEVQPITLIVSGAFFLIVSVSLAVAAWRGV